MTPSRHCPIGSKTLFLGFLVLTAPSMPACSGANARGASPVVASGGNAGAAGTGASGSGGGAGLGGAGATGAAGLGGGTPAGTQGNAGLGPSGSAGAGGVGGTVGTPGAGVMAGVGALGGAGAMGGAGAVGAGAVAGVGAIAGVGGAGGAVAVGGTGGMAGAGGMPREKHALIIGVDGFGSNQFKNASTPRMDALIAGNTAYTYTGFAGGRRGTATEQNTSSWPGWASIHTGVWANKHGITSNAGLGNNNFAKYPPLCKRLHGVKPTLFCSSIVHWAPINDGMVMDANHEAIGTSDDEVRKLVVNHLATADPHVLFVHFDELDSVGHSHGSDSNQYRSKLTEIDTLVGALIDAVNARPNAAGEDWMILIVSDHGHRRGGGHGGQSDDERTIPMINSSSGAIKGEVAKGPGHVAVPPTVFAHLGLPADPSWGWVAKPFGM